MKILQLAPQFPFPEDNGGKIGIASTFRQLSYNSDVTFFCFDDKGINPQLLNIANQYGRVIVYPHNTKNSPLRIFLSLFRRKPLYLTKHYNSEIIKYLSVLIENEKFDIIHADHTAMAPIAIELSTKYNIPCGLRLHNVEHLIWERYFKSLNKLSPKAIYVKNQYEKMKFAESELMNSVNINFPITEDDAELARKVSPKSNIVVAGPGINLECWTPDDIQRNPLQLVHATTYNWIHNVDAVRWFIKNVMPGLHRINPSIILNLFGKNPPDDFYDFDSIGVRTLGFVPDIKPYLSSAGIYIAPLFVGGGIRIKILEAMAMKLPVIATRIAAEGINAGKEDGLIVVQNEIEYIDEISKLVNNPEMIFELGNKARNFVLNNYTWEKSIGIIYKSYQDLLK